MTEKTLSVMLALSLGINLAAAQEQVAPATTTAPATAAATAPASLVTGTLIVPADAASFRDRTVELLLFEYDPRLAGAPARQLAQVVIKPFGHDKGRETSVDFRIGDGAINPARGYYITAFILDGTTRTHIGEIDGKSGLNKVLTNGSPRDIKLICRAVK